MIISPEILLNALEGNLTEDAIVQLTSELRDASPSSVRNLTAQANVSITGDGNIIGNNNISLVIKGQAASELAYVLREILGRRQPIHQLPAPVADFVGRQQEIKKLIGKIRATSTACISGISGMGGVGKTQLALLVASQLYEQYPDGLSGDKRPQGGTLRIK